jgi:hypothetical protein
MRGCPLQVPLARANVNTYGRWLIAATHVVPEPCIGAMLVALFFAAMRRRAA